MQEMGADSICVKDMAGILTPARGIEFVRALKEVITVPIVVIHTAQASIAQLTYQAVIEAGADRIDTALSPLSEGTIQPPTEFIGHRSRELGYDI